MLKHEGQPIFVHLPAPNLILVLMISTRDNICGGFLLVRVRTLLLRGDRVTVSAVT